MGQGIPGNRGEASLSAGTVLYITFLCALWVARKLTSSFVLNGTLVGVVAVVLTAGFVFAAKPEDRLMYIVSFALRIVGAYLGGLVAQRHADRVRNQAPGWSAPASPKGERA